MNNRFSFTIGHLTKLAQRLDGEYAQVAARDPEGLADLAFQESDMANLKRQLNEVNEAIDMLRKQAVLENRRG